MMVFFVPSFFPRDVLDEILNLIESVSEGLPSYSSYGKKEELGLDVKGGMLKTELNVFTSNLKSLNFRFFIIRSSIHLFTFTPTSK